MLDKYLKTLLLITIFFFLADCTSMADDEKKKSENKPGSINIHSDNSKPEVDLKLGGRAYGDWMWSSSDDNLTKNAGSIISGNEWRAAWLELKGNYGKDISFVMQYDLSQGETTAKDVWIGINHLPAGQLRIGHMKEPFSLEMMVSGKNTVLMERSLANALAPGRNTGIALVGYNLENNVTWGAGVFTEADNLGQAKAHDNNLSFSTRLTCLPWKNGKSLLHLGAAWSYRNINKANGIRFSSRPESHLVYKMADTGKLDADSLNLLGLEFAAMKGRFFLQGEYIEAYLETALDACPCFKGFYLLGSYFITNDLHGYNRKSGTPGGINPAKPFGIEGGTGAWEMALRYSQLDLDDSPVFGGTMKDITIGLNCYLNKYTRMMVNYIHADRDAFGTADIIQMRYQFSF